MRERARRVRDRLLAGQRFLRWKRLGWGSPAPHQVKVVVLRRWGLLDAVWIETATYRGDTTRDLASFASHVYSIEPSSDLYVLATRNLTRFKNIILIRGLSEKCLSPLLRSLNGPVNLFLDGHFSEGITFKGLVDSPIQDELDAIEESLESLGHMAIFIDDFDSFPQHRLEGTGYPARHELVAWASDWALIGPLSTTSLF